MAMVASASSGICLAAENSGALQAYTDTSIDEMQQPVVLDKDYPEQGFRSHSWITGTGSDTIAHTQLINMATGAVIKQLDRNCSYTEPEFEYSSN